MKEMLIFVDTKDNKNKFYYLELSGNTVNIEYGRVGSAPQKTSYSGGEKMFNKKMNEKLAKGYKRSSVALDMIEESTNSTSGSNILEIAMDQIKTDDISKKLIEKLVKQNIHNITSNSKIKYDIKSGYFKTDLGIITKSGVEKAIEYLNEIEQLVAQGFDDVKIKNKFIKLNEEYFTIIPTKVSNLREFSSLLITNNKISSQLDICTALLDSLEIIEKEKFRIKSSEIDTKVLDTIFEAEVLKLTNKKEFERIVKMFEQSKNSNHGRNTNSYKIESIYKVSLGKEEKEYRSDLSNQMELFHGTKVANLLSILKSGLLMPKYSPGSVTGYMFGQGLYFSDQSTKSLNYCDGMYWNNAKSQDKIYMFIADIAMGNFQVPRGSTSKHPDKGYHSYWAKPGQSGIQNNEMIIFNNNQIKLKYILEISK